MTRKLLTGLLCIMILTSLAFITLNANGESSTPNVYVYDPITQGNVSSAPIGQNFTVQIIVANVRNLVGFEIHLTFNISMLSYVSDAEGPFLNASGAYQSYYVSKPPGSPSLPNDTVNLYDTLLSPTLSTTATGTGVLAIVTFKVLAEGIGKLYLHDTVLVGYSAYVPPPTIPHTEQSGYFALPLPKTIIEPAETINSGIAPGQNINININVSNMANVYNWTLTLKWAPDLLNATSVTEGPFLNSAGATTFTFSVNRTEGLLLINDTLTGGSSGGVSGNGTLATVTFNVMARGTTDISIPSVAMFKKDGTYEPSATESGYFSNIVRDVAITSVTLSSNSVDKGQSINITVVAENHGVANETFQVKVDYDSHIVGSPATISNLVPSGSKTLVFKWDTTNVDPGTYTITAIADTVPGETNTADNTRTAGPVTIGGSSGLNLILIAGVIAAIAIVAIIVFLLLRRRAKKK